MFFLKKLIAPFLLPVMLCCELLVVGVILLLFTKWQKTGRFLLVAGTVLLLLFSNTLFSESLLHPLEYYYPTLLHPEQLADQQILWIVVLGGGHTSDAQLPCASQLNDASLVRLIEAISLKKSFPLAKLIVSGGGVFDPVPHARILADVAISLNVSPEAIVIEPDARDTMEEARQILPIVKNDTFILVTSAAHMPRAMALFNKQGMQPIPAPVGHMAKKITRFSPSLLFPNGGALDKTQQAFHEYLGLLWAKIRGLI